ncbi:phosphonate ABC transporter, permease protein PhnE [Bdellovibrio sp.]|uniref:phosphonate ABC transporter, permease protein PhnE n=1 Tax=Bdellovibrio sp. TaxID=28201 RepID=UPI0039E59D70
MMSFNFKRVLFDSVVFSLLFVVALVVITKPDEEAMLMLGRNSLVFLGGCVLGAFVSSLFAARGIKTAGDVLFAPRHLNKLETAVPWYKTVWGWQIAVALGVTFAVAIVKTNFSIWELTDIDGFQGAMRLFKGIFNPNWEVLPAAVNNIIETIFMAFLATALAIPLAFVLSFLCAKNIMKGPVSFIVYTLLRTVLNVTRSVEALIWAIIFSVWVGIGPFAGMLALMIHSVASLAKQYSEMVETVSEGPIEGIQATGATKLQTIWFAVVPQIVLPYISFTVYRWDINVRMATIIGLVGGGGIGTMLIQYQGQAMWREVGCIIVVIAIVVWLMDAASAYIREALK